MNSFTRQIEHYRRAAATLGTGKFAPKRRTDAAPPNRAADGLVSGDLGGMIPGAGIAKKVSVFKRNEILALVNQDPITWGIHAMQRRLICQTPWDIVPDLTLSYEELNRLEDQAYDNINDYGYETQLESTVLDFALVLEANVEVRKIIESKKTKDDTEADREKKKQITYFFRYLRRTIEQRAQVRCGDIRRFFQRPNEDMETSMRSLLELVVRDLQIDDAGIIMKNYNGFGALSELWHAPGYQIDPIVYPDFTLPKPPNAAYRWDNGIKTMGWYTKNQMSYIMANPQGTGVGMAPINCLLLQLTASILGDRIFIANMEEGNVPPGIMNLKDATKAQRDGFERMLNKKIDMSKGNRMIVISRVPSENGELQYIPIPKGVDFQKMQVNEWMKTDPGIKAFAHGFNADDVAIIQSDGKSDKDSQDLLSTRRAITGPLTLIEDNITADIIHTEFQGSHDVAFRFDKNAGRTSDPLKSAQADSILVTSGIDSRNDVRKRRKERPIQGGDIHMVQTGNQLLQVDSFEEMDGDILDPDQPGTNPDGSVNPVANTDPKKRNNATSRANMKGNQSRGNPPMRGG